MTADFEWNPAKDRANREQHGISCEEATELFTSGVDYLEIYDAGYSEEEDRFIAIGPIRRASWWWFSPSVTRTGSV